MPKIYTAGYEGRTLGDFIAGLCAAGIRLVADVREAPISRKPGFARTALSRALAERGIDYLHLRPLGCPKSIRDAYREDGDWVRYTRDFLAHLRGQQTALDELAAACAARPTALMCFEADFNACHRTYVARAVARRNDVAVAHLVGAGIVEEDTAHA